MEKPFQPSAWRRSAQTHTVSMLHGAQHCTHLVDDAGSVVCLCSRACRMIWSFMDIWTSAGISGEVWLIFTAASRKPSVPVSFSLSAMVSWLQAASLWETLEEMALFLQGTQHSFQKRKRKTATKARPHTLTITARRLMESSKGRRGEGDTQAGSRRGREGEEKRKEKMAVRKL